MFDIAPIPKPRPFKSRFHLGYPFTKHEQNRYITNRQMEAYQNLVIAIRVELDAIHYFGTFSLEAIEAEKETTIAKRRYEIWRKK